MYLLMINLLPLTEINQRLFILILLRFMILIFSLVVVQQL